MISQSELRLSRAGLKYILEAQYGMRELIWVNKTNIAYYLRVESHLMPAAFGGKWGFKASFFSTGCRGTNYFGNISTLMHWLWYMFGVVSVP